ncbi:citron Rho-interacting kinase-like [Ctenocephalides felis]|uniref:citron Rho-interacting kinase-like n=1 Tax=Ctenocephalides felis TaxID=7515 RepID=UPI000E6E59EE|nr:citron Rho-interacting kinase-like [Ctenocephalides felis]
MKEKEVQEKSEERLKIVDSEISKGGWVKLPQRNNSNWERKYIQLVGSDIHVYANEPSGKSEPATTIQLRQDNSCTVVTPEVSETDVNNTARSDLPFIIKIELIPTTTCWPATTHLIMALSPEEKSQWLSALQSCLGDACVARKYTGSKYIQFKDYKMVLDVNCAIEVNGNGILIGAEEGLYSYQMGNKPVNITGVVKVYQIAFVRSINMALLICGEDRKLVSADLRHLESLAQRSACVEPHLDVSDINFANQANECCHLFQASDPPKSSNESSLLCAATPTHLLIFKYDKLSSEYVAVKILDTSEPISSVLFTENTIMVCAHKFFEINTDDYTAEEFLDSTDTTLSHVIFAHKRKSFPITVLAISSDEYLLCFNEFGVFVDDVGRRSRSQDILWSHIPISFTYRKPYLFIVHYSTVEVIRISNESFNAPPDAEDYHNYPPQVFIELKNPRYLGNSSSKGSIYALNALNTGPEIVKLEGGLIIRNDYTFDTIDGSSDVGSVADSNNLVEPIYAQINPKTKGHVRRKSEGKPITNVSKTNRNSGINMDCEEQSDDSYDSSIGRELDALNAEQYSSQESITTAEAGESDKKVRFVKKQTEL